MTGYERQPLCDGVNFRHIKDERFKTGRISANFMLPLDSNTASANAMIPYMLRRASREYPDFTRLNERLSELYGATLHADVHKLGEVQVLTLSAASLDDRYTLSGEKISKELAGLLCGILFDPPLQDGLFKQDDFEQEHRQMVELIDSEFNDKRTYARQRCEELMCSEERFGVNRLGTRNDMQSLTSAELTEAWRNALKTARIELMLLGNFDPDPVQQGFSEALSKIQREKTVQCSTQVRHTAGSVREFNDKMDVAQCKLVMGFRSGIAEPQEETMAARLMTVLYGGTPHSKLFANVRERMSLCYYCSSRYDRNKGIMMVESGVEAANMEKARTEIIRQLEEVKLGHFDDNELAAAKLSLANNFRTISDYLSAMESWSLLQTFDRKAYTPFEAADEVEKITRDEVIFAANRVTLDTVYTLTGNEEAEA